MAVNTMHGCTSYNDWSRRNVLRGVALGGISWLTGIPSALANLTVRPKSERDTLVVLFLRGGADGLNIVVPYGEDAYHRSRPSLGLGAPNGARLGDRTLDLDGFFGFHPALAPILPLYKDGHLACIHAIGSGDGTRSHFEAMSAMERGLNNLGPGSSTVNGWIARYLNETADPTDSPLRAVAIGDVMPDSLRGAISASALAELNDYKLNGSPTFQKGLESRYASGADEMAVAGRETLDVLRTLNRLDYKGYRPQGGATYPTSDLGNGLRQVAFLQKAEVGLEVAFLDKGGWDTHVAQGGSTGWQAGLLTDVAQSLQAFAADMGSRMNRTTVIVMTEFGRRAYENSGLGTDHGRGSVMFALGGHVLGGKVHSQWPGLEEHQLEGPGDLRVTTDYRRVLAEALSKRMGVTAPGAIFPSFEYSPVQIFN